MKKTTKQAPMPTRIAGDKQKKTPYQSWRMPFSGVDRTREMQAKLGFSKVFGIHFGMRF